MRDQPLILDFERPIVELEQKIEELRHFSELNKLPLSAGIKELEAKLKTTKKEVYSNLTPWQKVQLARHPQRPYTLDYIDRICSHFIELHGDRRFADDAALIGGFATIDKQSVMIIGQQKGRNVSENIHRNFGMSHPEGYRKAMRLMKIAEKARLPIISFIDTPGAYPGIGSEERHIAEAIAVNLREMFILQVPILCIVIGEGGSGGALGIGIGDRLLIMENAYYSVITPEGCAAILWKDSSAAEKAATALKLTAQDLFELKIIDTIIPEPLGGANQDPDKSAVMLKRTIMEHLNSLRSLTLGELLEQRYTKYRNIGEWQEINANITNITG